MATQQGNHVETIICISFILLSSPFHSHALARLQLLLGVYLGRLHSVHIVLTLLHSSTINMFYSAHISDLCLRAWSLLTIKCIILTQGNNCVGIALNY